MHVRYHIVSHLIYFIYQGLFPTKLNHWYYLFAHICTQVTYETKKWQQNREMECKFKLSTIENPRYTYFSQWLWLVIKCQSSIVPYTLPFCAMFTIVSIWRKKNFFRSGNRYYKLYIWNMTVQETSCITMQAVSIYKHSWILIIYGSHKSASCFHLFIVTFMETFIIRE